MNHKLNLQDSHVDSANVEQCSDGSKPCYSNPCLNGARCYNDEREVDGYRCQCTNGYR